MVNGFRYYRALESVSTALQLSLALLPYTHASSESTNAETTQFNLKIKCSISAKLSQFTRVDNRVGTIIFRNFNHCTLKQVLLEAIYLRLEMIVLMVPQA